MRKALLPALASLLICGTATAALIANNAQADQSNRRPVMLTVAQNAAPAEPEAGSPSAMVPGMGRVIIRAPREGQLCQDMYARKAGDLAFLEAKLQLNAGQQALFARWKAVSLDNAKRDEGACNTRVQKLRTAQLPDMMLRLDREEAMLKTRLADIQAERPALEALYGALNQTQKQEFAQTAGPGLGDHMHMAMVMMRQPLGRRLGRGPDGGPPMPAPPQ
jgi:LTXXQ motif family protein